MNKWISVKDRLPPHWEMVIAVDETDIVTLGWQDNKEVWRLLFIEGNDIATYPVTHWQNLPELPNDDNDS